MIHKHPADDALQQYCMDKQHCSAAIIEHIEGCEECKARVEVYRLLFSGIKEQPEPVFDFNLSQSVLARIPSRPRGISSGSFFIYAVVIAAILLTTVAGYFFRDYLQALFSGIAPLLIYLAATIAICVLAGLFVEMYRHYQKKIQQLDFY